MNRKIVIAIGTLVMGAFVYLWVRKNPQVDLPQAGEYSVIPVGLSPEESEKLHHTYQGTNLFPLAFLYALKDQESGKMMIEILQNYGFLLENRSPHNPYALPVGLGGEMGDFLGMQVPQIGLNCAACHTAQIHYQGKDLRIDGAPNMIDIEKWTVATANNAQFLLTDKGEALAFIARFLAFTHEEGAQSVGSQLGIKQSSLDRLHAAAEAINITGALEDAGSEADSFIGRIVQGFERIHERVKNQEPRSSEAPDPDADISEADKTLKGIEHILFTLRERINMANKTVNAIKASPPAGPGRDDAWSLVNLIVMDDQSSLLTRPIVIPHLFGNANYHWFHADGNTNSVMDRNLAQGIALGADVSEDGVTTSLLPRRINEMDMILRKLKAPKWPELFPAIDEDLCAQGETIFHSHPIKVSETLTLTCAKCHSTPGGKNYPEKLIGTNRMRWSIFNAQGTDGPQKLQALAAKVVKVKEATMAARGIPKSEYDSWEINGTPEWRNTTGYMAHELKGIWASPPYLHNGSVRTLYQLLLPEAQREQSFYVGNREFDPKEVGFLDKPGVTNFKFDTTEAANTNTGHNFGKDLTEEERWALIEYLKSL